MTKIGRTRFLQAHTLGNYTNITLQQFPWQKSGKYNEAFGRNGPKTLFLDDMTPENDKKMAKIARTRFLPAYTLGNYSNRTLWQFP